MNKALKIIFIIMSLFFIFNLFIMLSSRNDMQYAVYGLREDRVSAEGIIIKDEILVDSDGDKRFYYSDGERVSKGTRIASYVGAGTDDALLSELATVEGQIKLLKDGNISNAGSDPALLGEQIKEATRRLTLCISKKDFNGAEEIKNQIILLREREKNGGEDSGDTLDSLYAKKADLEAKIGGSGASVYSPAAGVLFLQSDGYEEVLTPGEIENITVDRLLNIENEKKAVNTGDFKITDNFTFYIASIMDTEDTEGLEPGKAVSLRFAGFSSETVRSEVVFISEEADGKNAVVFSCNKMAEELLLAREVSFDIIKSSYEGFILPVSALAEEDGAEGVYVRNGVNHDFRKVKVIYRDDDTIIVSRQPAEDNELLIYDNVVVNP